MKHNGPYKKDFSGKKFGRLSLIEHTGEMRNGSQMYRCLCDCGTSVVVRLVDMKRGQTISCGCFRKEVATVACIKRSLPAGRAAFLNLLSHYRYRAKKKNIIFNLTEELFFEIINSKCFYCNTEPQQIFWPSGTKTTGPITYNGIDRVDSRLGYISENSVPCCGNCNVAKMNLTQKEFLALIEKIYKNRIEK